MAHKLRDERPGYHHVGTRGNNKQTIFLDDRDRACFLTMLDRIAERHDWHILGYSLMRNHYHLVLRVEEAGLARGMCELNTGYATTFNANHGRSNHLFGRRYWNDIAKDDAHLKNVLRYVLQNPRRAGAQGPLESHPWTSYQATVGTTFGLGRFARNELLALFGDNPLQAIASFNAFCDEPAAPRDDPAGHARRQPP